EAPDRVGWHPEFERGQSPTWAEYARELANSGRRIVHIAQQVGERDVVERVVGERQPLALSANKRAIIRGARGEHVSALVQTDHLAAIAADQCTGDHACTGCDVEHAVLGLCADGFDEGAPPPRVL